MLKSLKKWKIEKNFNSCKGIPQFFRKQLLLSFFTFPFFLNGITITLTFDDGYACHYETVCPLLEKYGMLATFYVTTSLLNQPGYLSTEQVMQLAKNGHEIASHCVTHRALTHLTPGEVEHELRDSKKILENLIGTPVLHFAPPFGAFPLHLRQIIKKYYHSNRTILPGLNVKDSRSAFSLYAYVVLSTTSLAQLENWMNQAIIENKWLILVYHHIDEREDIVNVSPQTFEEHLKLIQSKKFTSMTIQTTLEGFLDSFKECR